MRTHHVRRTDGSGALSAAARPAPGAITSPAERRRIGFRCAEKAFTHRTISTCVSMRTSRASMHALAKLYSQTGPWPLRLAAPWNRSRTGAPDHTRRRPATRSHLRSKAVIERATIARRAIVLGANFIGLEVAAALRSRDIEVHVVAPDRRPMERVLGQESEKNRNARHAGAPGSVSASDCRRRPAFSARLPQGKKFMVQCTKILLLGCVGFINERGVFGGVH